MARKRGGLSFYKRERKFNTKIFAEIMSWVFWGVVMSLIAFVFVYLFGIRTSIIGPSMEPRLYNAQEILIDRFTYILFSPKQGDVVVFRPNGNENAHYYVKRVIGCPGDTVLIKDGVIYINNVIYDENGMFDHAEYAGIAENMLTLGDDEYFVLGDNLNDSEDSRSSNIGFVKKDYIIGRAWFHFSSVNGDPAGFIK